MDAKTIICWGFGIFISLIMLVPGAILLISKPKINLMFGYRTSLSMANEDNWRYANNIAAYLLTLAGFVLLLETIILNLLKININIFMPVFMSTLLVSIIFLVFLPHILLKKHILKQVNSDKICEKEDTKKAE